MNCQKNEKRVRGSRRKMWR